MLDCVFFLAMFILIAVFSAVETETFCESCVVCGCSESFACEYSSYEFGVSRIVCKVN